MLTVVWVLITAAVIAISVMIIRGRHKPKTGTLTAEKVANLADGEQAGLAAENNAGISSADTGSKAASRLFEHETNYLPSAGSAEAEFFDHLRKVVDERLMIWRCTTPVGLHQNGKQIDKVPAVFSVHQDTLGMPLFLLYFTNPGKLKAHEPQIDLLSQEAKRKGIPLLMIDESSELDEDQLRALLAQHVPVRYLAGIEEDIYSQEDSEVDSLPDSRADALADTQVDSHGNMQAESVAASTIESREQVVVSPTGAERTTRVERKRPVKTCPECQSPMSRKRAKSGRHKGYRFWVCRRYPGCRHIERID